MSDDLVAPQEGVEEVVQTEAEQAPAAEAPESTEGLTPEATAEGTTTPEDKGPSRSERRRIARERAELEKKEAEQKAADAERRIAQLRDAAAKLPVPKDTDFDTHEEYVAALSARSTLIAQDSREAERLEAEAKDHAEQARLVRAQQARDDAENFQSQVVEAKAKYADFEQVALQQAPITAAMAPHIMQSDQAAEIAYFLGKNPGLAVRIGDLSDIGIAREIGRLEATLSAPPPKKVSTAPDPINPLKGSGTATGNPFALSPDEYKAWREAGGKP